MRAWKILHHVFGGCPKRNICGLRQDGGKTCIYGPYQYCGRYRLEDDPKKGKRLITKIEA